MAAGAFIFPAKAKLNFFSATGLLTATSTNFRLALVGSAWTPDNSDTGNEVWADASANEITAGNGYSAGGIALSSVTLALNGSGGVKFTAAASTWTASGGSIPAWRRGVVYYLGTLNGKANPLVGQIEDWLAENYAQVRLDRGWTWEQLAEDFDRQGAPELAAMFTVRIYAPTRVC
jgi:hypothetical protein